VIDRGWLLDGRARFALPSTPTIALKWGWADAPESDWCGPRRPRAGIRLVAATTTVNQSMRAGGTKALVLTTALPWPGR